LADSSPSQCGYLCAKLPPQDTGEEVSLASQTLASHLSNLPGQQKEVDLTVELGETHRHRCRLIARRAKPELADQRKRELKQRYWEKGKQPSKDQLALCEWHILATNLPKESVSVAEIIQLYRHRWRIETLFKSFKQSSHWIAAVKHNGSPDYVEAMTLIGLLQAILTMRGYRLARQSCDKLRLSMQQLASIVIEKLAGLTAVSAAIKLTENDLYHGQLEKRKRREATLDEMFRGLEGYIA